MIIASFKGSFLFSYFNENFGQSLNVECSPPSNMGTFFDKEPNGENANPKMSSTII
jgi:hypothetical protein